MSELQQRYSKANTPDAWETFAATLSNFGVVDVGKIEKIVDGIATVKTYFTKGADAKRVQAEIVMIGNYSGYLSTIDIGQNCMVFYPRSPSDSLKDETIDTMYGVYNERAAKCLPITHYTTEQLVVLSNTGVSLNISSSDYSLMFNESQVMLLSEVFQLVLDIEQKQAQFGWGTGVGGVQFNEDGGLEITSGRSYDKQKQIENWKNRVQQLPDGSLIVETAAGMDDNSNSFGTCTTTFTSDGSLNVDVGKQKDGKVASKVVISKDGNIKMSVFDGDDEKSSIVLDKAGTVSITTTDAYSIEGVGVTIDGTDGKVSIKNGQYSLADAFNDLITVLDKFATQGSPAAHTAVPGQFTQLQQSLANFLE